LRKPLCNLGSVFAAEIHGARVVLQSCWHVITDSVGAIVEVRARESRAGVARGSCARRAGVARGACL
jgi:hypothetical protein